MTDIMDVLQEYKTTYRYSFPVTDDTLPAWRWLYTPQDELRDRLNDRLQGKEPSMVWNTPHWRESN